jgi:hypothetical protein
LRFRRRSGSKDLCKRLIWLASLVLWCSYTSFAAGDPPPPYPHIQIAGVGCSPGVLTCKPDDTLTFRLSSENLPLKDDVLSNASVVLAVSGKCDKDTDNPSAALQPRWTSGDAASKETQGTDQGG